MPMFSRPRTISTAKIKQAAPLGPVPRLPFPFSSQSRAHSLTIYGEKMRAVPSLLSDGIRREES